MSLTRLLICVTDLTLCVLSVFELGAKQSFGINLVMPPACSKGLVSMNHKTCNDSR